MMPVEEAEVSQTLELVGTVLAQRRSSIAAQTSGAVKELLVDEGDRVRKGDPLVRLDAEELGIQIEAARAGKDELASRYAERKERLARSQKLFEKGRISEEEYKEDFHAEKALLHGVERADSEIRRLQDELGRKTVRAPFDGFITHKHTEVGEWLDEGGLVFDLLDLSKVRVELDLPERYAFTLRRDAPVTVEADALPGRRFEGKIMAVMPDADPLSHTLPVKVEVENPRGELYAGMFAKGIVSLEDTRKALLVPKDAIVNRGPVNLVFVLEEGQAREVTVRRLQAYTDRVEVAGDLRAGDEVVVRGNERIRGGQPLRRLDEEVARSAPPAEQAR